jgi:hypothetical protein
MMTKSIEPLTYEFGTGNSGVEGAELRVMVGSEREEVSVGYIGSFNHVAGQGVETEGVVQARKSWRREKAGQRVFGLGEISYESGVEGDP